MDSTTKSSDLNLLILNEPTRQHILAILERNHYHPRVAADPGMLLSTPPSPPPTIYFIDGEAIDVYGWGLISQITSACPGCRIIYLYDRAHREHIRRIMDLGVYGCIMAPYVEWEILTMIRHLLAKKASKPPLPNNEQLSHPH